MRASVLLQLQRSSICSSSHVDASRLDQLWPSPTVGKLAQAPDRLSYGSWRRELNGDASVWAAYEVRLWADATHIVRLSPVEVSSKARQGTAAVSGAVNSSLGRWGSNGSTRRGRYGRWCQRLR